MNPERILRCLDSHLRRPTRLILHGRAALALGFPDAPAAFGATLDVDAILPEIELSAIEADDQFWLAIEATNADLDPDGLYLTHLFTDSQIILSPDWLTSIRPIALSGLSHLQLFRPSTENLILTKMMRIDPQDREDIGFLLQHALMTAEHLEKLASSARIPDIQEIQSAFSANLAWLRQQLPGTSA